MLPIIPTILAVLSLSAVTFGVSFAETALVFLVGLLASYIYYVTIGVFVGMKQIVISDEAPLILVWQCRAAEIAAVASLFALGSYSVFYYVLPAAVITFCVGVINSLKTMGVIEIAPKSEEDEEV